MEKPSKPYFRSRGEAIACIEQQILNWRSPRVAMAISLGVAGLFCFLMSVVLLRCGVIQMAVRYAFGLLVGYLVFYFCLWFWTGGHPMGLDKTVQVDLHDLQSSGALAIDGVPPLDFTPENMKSFDIRILLALFGGIFWMIYYAPTLLAELTLDNLSSLQTYHRIRQTDRYSYPSTFWRITARPFFFIVVVVIGGSGLVQIFAPNVHSLGQMVNAYNQMDDD
jgi:hypothetical protein